MRPWRKLHAGIITSDKLATVSDSAAWLFALLVVAQDDEGCYPWTPAKVRALCVGRNWTSARTATFLNELVAARLVEMEGQMLRIIGGGEKNGKPAGYHDTFLYEVSEMGCTDAAHNFSAGQHTSSPPEEIRGDKRREEGEAGTPKVARNPRTLDEEKAFEYAKERGYGHAETTDMLADFRDYWQSKGWRDKDGPIKDVNARFQYWVRQQPKYGHPPSEPQPSPEANAIAEREKQAREARLAREAKEEQDFQERLEITRRINAERERLRAAS